MEIIKSLGSIGVTKSLFKIPLLRYSTILKPLPAIQRFISMYAKIPGNKKSIYLCGLDLTSSSLRANMGSISLISLSMDKRVDSKESLIASTCLT